MVKVDKIDTLECTEEKGVITRVRREAYVSGLTDNDWKAMFSALEAAGVPASYSKLNPVAEDTGWDLYCTQRNVKMLAQDQASVELVYELFYESQYVKVGAQAPPYSVLQAQIDTSIQQVTTNKDAPYGSQIVLEHTYPNDDPNFAGQTHKQGGEITVYQAQKSFTLEFIKDTNTPWYLGDQMLGAVNNGSWLGGAARTWMCTAITFKLHKIYGTVQYKYNTTFQYNPDTWSPTAVFVDEVTGKPPEGLISDVGIKTINYHDEVNFAAVLLYPVIG